MVFSSNKNDVSTGVEQVIYYNFYHKIKYELSILIYKFRHLVLEKSGITKEQTQNFYNKQHPTFIGKTFFKTNILIKKSWTVTKTLYNYWMFSSTLFSFETFKLYYRKSFWMNWEISLSLEKKLLKFVKTIATRSRWRQGFARWAYSPKLALCQV